MRTLALVAALLAGHPALVYHSFVMFDLAKELTLVGTIKEVQFTSPHVWLQVLVPGARRGQAEWSIEAGAPGMLLRTGWKSTTLKAGDRVTIIATHPARSGAHSGESGTSDSRRRCAFSAGRSARATAIAPLILLRLRQRLIMLVRRIS